MLANVFHIVRLRSQKKQKLTREKREGKQKLPMEIVGYIPEKSPSSLN